MKSLWQLLSVFLLSNKTHGLKPCYFRIDFGLKMPINVFGSSSNFSEIKLLQFSLYKNLILELIVLKLILKKIKLWKIVWELKI